MKKIKFIVVIIFILSLFGASADKNIDATSMIVKEVIKGVYDESRVETMAFTKEKYPQKKIAIIGFCFGAHAALIASSLKGIDNSFCFYGAGITAPRTDTNFAPIDLLKKVSGKLNFICGSADDLIPLKDRLEIKKRFKKFDHLGERFSYVEIEGADHGFMCEERESFHKDASLIGWNLLMKELNFQNS